MLTHIEIPTPMLLACLAAIGLIFTVSILYLRQREAQRLIFAISGLTFLAVAFLLINWTTYEQTAINPTTFAEASDLAQADTLAKIDSANTAKDKFIPPPPPPPPATWTCGGCCTGRGHWHDEPIQDSLDLLEELNTPPKIETPKVQIIDMLERADEMAYFPKFEGANGDYKDQKKCGDEYMLAFIYGELKYPEEAKNNNIQGTVVISFTVDEQGNLSDFIIRKDIDGGGCGAEALRIVRKMAALPEKWTPAKHKGEIVKLRYNLPIRFTL